jgi:hypothetical protein
MNTSIKIPFMLDLLFIGKFDCYHVYILYGKTVIILLAFYWLYYYYQWLIFLILNAFPHILAVSITVILFVSLIIGILAFISYQVILQVILLILEKCYSFHNRYSKIHKNQFSRKSLGTKKIP